MNRIRNPENILARGTLEREDYEGNQHECGRRVVRRGANIALDGSNSYSDEGAVPSSSTI